MKFYFTYGLHGQPFRGGWTMVEAPNRQIAVGAFQEVHPNKYPNRLNCSTVYTEQEFADTGMEQDPDGNCGAWCHEVIHVTLQQFCPSIRKKIKE